VVLAPNQRISTGVLTISPGTGVGRGVVVGAEVLVGEGLVVGFGLTIGVGVGVVGFPCGSPVSDLDPEPPHPLIKISSPACTQSDGISFIILPCRIVMLRPRRPILEDKSSKKFIRFP
jgi:hypothetical protein